MSNNKHEDILPYIKSITDLTISEKMVWIKANPTTYIWSTKEPSLAKIVVQRIVNTKRKRDETNRLVHVVETDYLIQVYSANKEPLISVDSSQNANMKMPLSILFEAIDGNRAKEALSFLDSVLPSKED